MSFTHFQVWDYSFGFVFMFEFHSASVPSASVPSPKVEERLKYLQNSHFRVDAEIGIARVDGAHRLDFTTQLMMDGWLKRSVEILSLTSTSAD